MTVELFRCDIHTVNFEDFGCDIHKRAGANRFLLGRGVRRPYASRIKTVRTCQSAEIIEKCCDRDTLWRWWLGLAPMSPRDQVVVTTLLVCSLVE